MSRNPHEILAQAHEANLRRFRLSAGIIGSDTASTEIDTYYVNRLIEIPVSTLKVTHVAVKRMLIRDGIPYDELEERSMTAKIGLGIGLLIGSQVLEEAQLPGYFDYYEEVLADASRSRKFGDMPVMFAAVGGDFAREMRVEGSSGRLYEPYQDGPSPEYDDYRNKLHADTLGFAASLANDLLEMNDFSAIDFRDLGER